MRLHYSPESQYVRKVMATAIETGLLDRIELIHDKADLEKHNPLLKRPTLITDDGQCILDSPVICEYLDSLHDGPKLFPPSGAERWQALRRQALGDGCLDAGVARVVDGRRPESERSPAWVARQTTVMGRGLDALEDEADALGDGVTIGHVAIACALGWFDLRFADDNWRKNRPALADWFEAFSERPSMVATVPKEPS